MNKDKSIKDLKERNDKLANQYRLRDIRCVHLEHENNKLKELCDKYEEEHNTTFIKWQNTIKVLDELEKWLIKYKNKDYYIYIDELLDKLNKLKTSCIDQ